MIAMLTGDATLEAAVLATSLPLLSFALIMLLTRSRPRLSAALSVGAVTISLGCALFLLGSHWDMQKPIEYSGRWLASGSLNIPFGFLLDPLSLLMLAVVSLICFLVQVYSLGYMAGDEGFSRYYGFMSLFAWAMMSLTLSPTILQLFIFWELVGLSSYLLIGFWYEKFSATQAGKKAFVMTRAGDVAFYVGLLVVVLHMGSFSILDMNGPQTAARMSPAVLTLSALLIFGGIVGKSAQFPLMTWLPDAMEGPTPVSALLHSATMVAAGVYLLGRLFPFFNLSPAAMSIFLAIGTVSMLLASTMAMVSRDIKQIWAYSTISQLGYMIMGLAAGGYFAGIFHLTTHAAFKALLFLCSGVFIHKFGTNDLFELAGRGSRRLKVPAVSMAVAVSALAGLPPLSGFFSKEAIMAALAGLSNPIWLATGLAGVFLTAYYAFRVIFIVFFPQDNAERPVRAGDPAGQGHTAGHGEAEYRVMAAPLVVLALISVLLGFCESPLNRFLTSHIPVPLSGLIGHVVVHDGEGHAAWLPYLATTLAAAGAGLAWMEFGRRGAARIGFVERVQPLHNLFLDRWYLDRFYGWVVDRVIDRGFSALFAQNDNKVIDGSIDAMCKGAVESGRLVALLHMGMVQYRLLVTFAVLVLLSLYFFLS
jgi:NADH-quinone oxidoreductase subunit L